MTKSVDNERDPTADLLKDLIIIQLATAGVSGHAIRQVVGVSMSRVTRITKVLKKRTKDEAR